MRTDTPDFKKMPLKSFWGVSVVAFTSRSTIREHLAHGDAVSGSAVADEG